MSEPLSRVLNRWFCPRHSHKSLASGQESCCNWSGKHLASSVEVMLHFFGFHILTWRSLIPFQDLLLLPSSVHKWCHYICSAFGSHFSSQLNILNKKTNRCLCNINFSKTNQQINTQSFDLSTQINNNNENILVKRDWIQFLKFKLSQNNNLSFTFMSAGFLL